MNREINRKIRLRGHHLICLHFFSGQGYDEAFINNLKDLMIRANNEIIEISDGADDVCKRCFNLKDNRCSYSENADIEIRQMDNDALIFLEMEKGGYVDWNVLKNKIPHFFSDWYKKYCSVCTWLKACEENEFFRKLLLQISQFDD